MTKRTENRPKAERPRGPGDDEKLVISHALLARKFLSVVHYIIEKIEIQQLV